MRGEGGPDGTGTEFTGYARHLVGLHDMLVKDVPFYSLRLQSEHGVNTYALKLNYTNPSNHCKFSEAEIQGKHLMRLRMEVLVQWTSRLVAILGNIFSLVLNLIVYKNLRYLNKNNFL